MRGSPTNHSIFEIFSRFWSFWGGPARSLASQRRSPLPRAEGPPTGPRVKKVKKIAGAPPGQRGFQWRGAPYPVHAVPWSGLAPRPTSLRADGLRPTGLPRSRASNHQASYIELCYRWRHALLPILSHRTGTRWNGGEIGGAGGIQSVIWRLTAFLTAVQTAT